MAEPGRTDWLPGTGQLNAGTCDWGDCDEHSVAVVNTREAWLPICRTHVSAARAEGFYVLIVETDDA